jgi:hypothetical protein
LRPILSDKCPPINPPIAPLKQHYKKKMAADGNKISLPFNINGRKEIRPKKMPKERIDTVMTIFARPFPVFF